MTEEKEKKTNKEKEAKPKKQAKEEKYTILRLVQQSKEDEAVIVGALANNHLLSDYYKEQEDKSKGFDITPTLTEKEFKKIIESFKNKEV